MTTYDFIIVGGGATGCALALMLAPLNKKVLLIEAQAQKQQADAAHFDERAIALSFGSQRIFERLGVWSTLSADAMPIAHIHVSDRGHFGHALLHAEDMTVPALGQVIPLRVLNSVLYQRVVATKAATILAPANVTGYQHEHDAISVAIEHDGATQTRRSSALLAADGTQSPLRQQAGIPAQIDHYEQTALITNVVSDGADYSYAYERFTESGPLALLPLSHQRWSLVWSLQHAQAEQLLHCSDKEFLQKLQQAFGWRVGQFSRVGARQRFGLQRIVSAWRHQGRLLLLGNAAQQVHPIAGQGFNLALRDAEALAQALQEQDWSAEFVQQFLQTREADQQQVSNRTDGLVRLFSNQYAVLSQLRGLALDAIQLSVPLRTELARRAMGV